MPNESRTYSLKYCQDQKIEDKINHAPLHTLADTTDKEAHTKKKDRPLDCRIKKAAIERDLKHVT